MFIVFTTTPPQSPPLLCLLLCTLDRSELKVWETLAQYLRTDGRVTTKFVS